MLPRGNRRSQLDHFIEVIVPVWFGGRILPVTHAIAERWGVLDGLIAATALEHGLTVATRNSKDFAGLGVVILNPWFE